MRTTLPVLCLAAAMMTFGASASADEVTLGSFMASGGWGVTLGAPVDIGAQAELRLNVPSLHNAGDTTTSLFNSPIGTSDIGRIYRADASTDSHFADAVRILANGTDNFLGLAMSYPDGVFATEDIAESQLGGSPDFLGQR